MPKSNTAAGATPMVPSANSLDCYVHVSGDASEPDDEGVQGLYHISVDTSDAVVSTCLLPEQEDEIARAVLDEFHENQGIECLDDFSIAVFLDGKEIAEAASRIDTSFTASASYSGSVNFEDIPEELRRLIMAPEQADSPTPGMK